MIRHLRWKVVATNMLLISLVLLAVFAADFTQQSIVETLPLGLETRYGVCFERALPQLLRALES